MLIDYEAPSAENLRDLKVRLNYSGRQMADLFGLASSQQWHKYCLADNPRPMSIGMLFLAGALLLGPAATVAQIFDWCREVGAKIRFVAEKSPARVGDQSS
jgi:hypothetical protein